MVTAPMAASKPVARAQPASTSESVARTASRSSVATAWTGMDASERSIRLSLKGRVLEVMDADWAAIMDRRPLRSNGRGLRESPAGGALTPR